MNATKNPAKTFLLFAIAALFFACDKNNNSEPFEIIGDVYVIKRTIDDEVKYANSYTAWGNQPMSVAKVSTPQGAEITLSSNSDNDYVWAKEPGTSDFITSQPVESNYQFLVVNEDISHQATDLLEFDDIDFTVISSTEFVSEGLSVQWESNLYAERYQIVLVNANGEVAFQSLPLLEQQKQLIFDDETASGTWYESPVAGQKYTVELLAYRYEDDAISDDYNHEIQEISVAEADITWQ